MPQPLLTPAYRDAYSRVSALVIQCLIVESFAAPIIQAVLTDEAEHLEFGGRWLAAWFPEVAAPIAACCERAVPTVLAMLHSVRDDLSAIGIDPADLVGEFVGCFQAAIVMVGFPPSRARALVARLAGRAAQAAA